MGQTQKRAGNIREMMSAQWKKLLSNLEWVPLRAIESSCTEDSHAQTAWDLYWVMQTSGEPWASLNVSAPSHISSCVTAVTTCLSLLQGRREKQLEQESRGSDWASAEVWTGCFDDRQIYDGIISFVCPVTVFVPWVCSNSLLCGHFQLGFKERKWFCLSGY